MWRRRRPWCGPPWKWPEWTVSEHAAARIEILPVEGLPEFRPGDDLTGAIARQAPWLRSGDVVVVTSKVVSKVEGRLVRVPSDPQARDKARRQLIEQESVRVLARIGRTVITENHLGVVQAASGVDASNVDRSEVALLPADPDASALALRNGLRERLGVEVAVVITDTMGRAWRVGQTDAAIGSSGLRGLRSDAGEHDAPGNETDATQLAAAVEVAVVITDTMGRAWRVGQTDAAIGSSGLRVLRSYAGEYDAQGNELAVTEIAVADEVAAAADLVKGKLTGVPVAVVRGLSIGDDIPGAATARDLVRPAEED